MPKSTVTEEDPHKLPEDTYLPARLIHVTEKTFNFVRKTDGNGKKAGDKDSFTKWTWDFEIADGEYRGLHAEIDTDPKVSVTPDGTRNKPAQFVEALREMPVEFGEGVDTDDYDGLPCVITCRHDKRERNDGQGYFYSEPVKDVFPASLMEELKTKQGQDPWSAPGGSEPPF